MPSTQQRNLVAARLRPCRAPGERGEERSSGPLDLPTVEIRWFEGRSGPLHLWRVVIGW